MKNILKISPQDGGENDNKRRAFDPPIFLCIMGYAINHIYRRNNWTPMETKDGTAWFGGKTHNSLADYISKDEIENFEDVDFLVIAWSNINGLSEEK
jgi:hypothetical protein